ncbi:MAG TPA: ribonuclease III [bacterium]|nr:ribonuclease III [Myxococcales bacterium]OQA59080.1 MAG: Ribonuclease 3 [bacterium ADurb.Bin270]HPW45568.1 ribonuclease III [bacterium]HQG13972.1 ribonuclease III [bacterium]HQH79954.1 ribonuclease III [bacterium]
MDLTTQEKKRLKVFEKKLGYKFRHRDYLKRALTHKSYTNELRLSPLEHNERYEYLGDAVLELGVSTLLMRRFPDHPEGELSKLRAAIVNEEQLAEISKEIGLGEFLYLGKGEDGTGGREKHSLLSDALEAVLGAVYLDRGFGKAFDLIAKLYDSVLDRAGGVGFVKDYKTRLQEVSQSRFKTVPKYRLMCTSGPDHRKIFEINLYINDEIFGVGKGHNKKSAEQEAARKALQKLEFSEEEEL